MPIPKPKAGEKEEEFISRCMGNGTMNKEYPDEKQRAGVCYTQWRERDYSEFIENNTYDIKDVEIFSAGKWNGDEYTEKDIDDMVSAFEELKSSVKPYLKLGHNEEQELLGKDGLPAGGWITALKRKGKILLADFKSVPKKIKDLIEKKAYGRFSSEIYWGYEINGKKYRRVLKAVALLGADTPAVTSLDDFINLYIEDKGEYENIKIYDKRMDEMDELTLIQQQVKEYREKEKAYEEKIVSLKETNTDLSNQVKTLTEKIEKTEKEKKDSEIASFIDGKVKELKILPSQVEDYKKLAEKDMEVVKKILEGMPSLIDEGEKSRSAEKPKSYSSMDIEEKDEMILEKAKEYAKENNISYKDAYSIVLRTFEEEV